jgi:hypothetical protein
MEHAAKDGKWAQVDQLQDLLGEFFTPAQDGAITEETVTVCAER